MTKTFIELCAGGFGRPAHLHLDFLWPSIVNT